MLLQASSSSLYLSIITHISILLFILSSIHSFGAVALHVQVSPTSVRGTLGSLNQLMICLGILAALLVNVALPVTDWRLMFNLAAAPAIILLLGEGTGCCGLFCCPNSLHGLFLPWVCCIPHTSPAAGCVYQFQRALRPILQAGMLLLSF
jgi:hypothetical protein